ncbi:ATP-binding protein [Pseudomonas cremoricolorata]|uniref:ATP-binding protein n=1 Tax=Pseudomonas cremoricolorata TaxID=157783 RepID=UPI0005343167|nr:ATP-binding protein [Pseudomonas cremoricolorata]
MVSQLSVLFCLALLASNLIGMALLHRHGTLLHPLSRDASLGQLVAAYHVAHALAPAQAAQLLSVMGDGQARFWLDEKADVEPFAARREEQRLAHDLRARLPLPTQASLNVQLERANGADARTHLLSASGWAPLRLRSSLALGNGQYLNAVQHPSGAYPWRTLLAYSLPVTTLPVLLVLIVCINRVIRPVKSLAAATERVSRGEWIAPLPLRGAGEARDLTRAFNTMQASLARHVEGRMRLLAAISHDLNTPLTELRLQVELLEEGPARDDMLESLGELSAMVRETLTYVREDAVQEATCTVNLNDVLGELTRRYQLLGQPVTWPDSVDIRLRCRPLALKRALTNLIDNALKHGTSAQVAVREQGDSVVLEILDQGPGLPEAWLEKVFEPFVRLGPSDHGLGLGLAIARSCIHAHGGELVLQNRQPSGLCAVIHLPRGD